MLLLLAAVLVYAISLKPARINAERYCLLLQQDSIAKQNVSTAVQSAGARAPTVKSSEANVERLVEIVGFEKICASLGRVINVRNIDVGGRAGAEAETTGKEQSTLLQTLYCALTSAGQLQVKGADRTGARSKLC